MRQEQTYFDFIQNNHQNTFEIHPVMHEFLIDSKQDNVQYFLSYFYQIKELKLSQENKDMFFFLLHPKASKVRSLEDYRYKRDLFCASLICSAFEHGGEVLLDVFEYFSEQVNHYVNSEHFKQKVANEEFVKSIVSAKGVEKIELLTQVKGLFLPNQKEKLSTWTKSYILNKNVPIMNSDSMLHKSKFKA